MPKSSPDWGGARKNAGKKTAPVLAAKELADIFSTISPEQYSQLEATLWDLAFGHKIVLYKRRSSASKINETEQELEVVHAVCKTCGRPKEDQPFEKVYVYDIPADRQALQLVLDHSIGKPNSKADEPLRPLFIIKHQVPGFGSKEYEADNPEQLEQDTE